MSTETAEHIIYDSCELDNRYVILRKTKGGLYTAFASTNMYNSAALILETLNGSSTT